MEVFRTSKSPVGGHALCVVGYDDNVGGGAFKIANSWGKNWGKSGHAFISFSDMEKLIKQNGEVCLAIENKF